MNKYAHLAPPKPPWQGRKCVTKIRFRDKEAAEKRAAVRGAKVGVMLWPYNCPMCLGWHVTSREPREVA